jgi:hypothetical protein
MKWYEAERLMTTARNPEKGKPIGNNTRLYFYDAGVGHENYYNIRLHGNQIMQIYRDRIVPMDGGWRTVTTKARLNEHLPQGFYVFQKDWEWFIQDMNTHSDEPTVYPFGDVYYIHDDNRVMLYSTHPKYPQVYEKDVVDWDEDFETGEEHQEYEPAFDTNIDQELYSMRKW